MLHHPSVSPLLFASLWEQGAGTPSPGRASDASKLAISVDPV